MIWKVEEVLYMQERVYAAYITYGKKKMTITSTYDSQSEAETQASVIVNALNAQEIEYCDCGYMAENGICTGCKLPKWKPESNLYVAYARTNEIITCECGNEIQITTTIEPQQQYNDLPLETYVPVIDELYGDEVQMVPNSAGMWVKKSEAQQKIQRYREFAEMIAEWKLPQTGKFWDKEKKEPMSYEAAWGSNGVRDYFVEQAKQLLSKE